MLFASLGCLRIAWTAIPQPIPWPVLLPCLDRVVTDVLCHRARAETPYNITWLLGKRGTSGSGILICVEELGGFVAREYILELNGAYGCG